MTDNRLQQPLGQMLVSKGVISDDQLRIALQEQTKTHQPLGRLLVRLGFLSEATIRDVLSENLGQESVDLTSIIVDPAALALIPKDIARRYQLLPLSVDPNGRVLTLTIADPDNIIALDQVRALLKDEYRLITQLASESDILRAIDQYYGFELSIDGILHEIEPGEMEYQTLQSGVNEFSQPVVRLIDALLTEAVQQGASDIHFEPESSFLRIRYRIDGVLRQMRSLHKSFWPAMVVRLKVMSNMNIAETRAPQDGRISLRLSGRPIDFRVASHPTTHGENMVLRILDRQKGIVALDQLGLDEIALNTLKMIVSKPEGIVLVTGPTGSGKTTTLYSVLNHVAEMAFRAAMTGHQVYSTLHTNSAIGAIPRLLDIGILPDIMAGNIIGIVAQRLVRILCNECKYPYQPDQHERKLMGIAAHQDITLYRAAGCDICKHQGYKGRMAIMELLKMDQDLDDLVARRASTRQLRETALNKGFRPLAIDGIRRILQGITSLAEISRVVDLTDRAG
ncbi:MAG: Flp pilus assembly complex ATPase component TadA [Nitrosomonadales bacterium]|nr:Flp pilus assembly complex ATPase component TadA [Nitrosomonadales bacterium]